MLSLLLGVGKSGHLGKQNLQRKTGPQGSGVKAQVCPAGAFPTCGHLLYELINLPKDNLVKSMVSAVCCQHHLI